MAASDSNSSHLRLPAIDQEKDSSPKPLRFASDPADFPDGGLKAWSVVLGAWCCLFTSFGWINCIGVFQNHYENNQLSTYSPSTVAWITSVETSMMYASSPVYGKIYDNYGPKPLLYFGTFAHVFGLMMTSLGQEYYQFLLAQSICSALGAAALFSAGTGPIGSWFWKNRALAFGVVASGSSLSGVLIPIMVTRLLPQVGFPWVIRICAFLFLFLLLIAIFTVEARTPPQPRSWELAAFFRPLRERPFLLNTLGLFCFSWGLFIPFNFLILEARYRGMSADLANYQIAILNGASIFGRVIPGWLGDRFGRFNIMILTTFLSAILVLALWIPARSQALTILFSILFGFTSGTFVSMAPALIQQLSSVQEIGIRIGTSFGIISIATLTGNPIAGALIDRNEGGYLYLKMFCGVAMSVGCSLLVAARTVQCGWRWRKI